MTPVSVDAMIDDVLRREGGFVDHPADRGGPTNMGITQETLGRHLKWISTVAEVRHMDENVARAIYRRNYYEQPIINKLPAVIQPFVFDSAVNHGPRRAIRFVQRVCNDAGFGPLVMDGVIGPETCAAAAQASLGMGKGVMLQALVKERRELYRRICQRDASQRVFIDGWMARLAEFEEVVP